MQNNLRTIARDFSKTYPVMDDVARRRRKGLKASAILKEVLQGQRIGYVLDVGCSNSILLDVVIEELEAEFGLGIDLDRDSLPGPTAKRTAVVADALAIPVKDCSVDLVLCNHTYEHVPDAGELFQEIERVLKPGGIVYFGAMNARWPIEPHFHMPLIHWLPKTWSTLLMRPFGYQYGYSEKPLPLNKLYHLVRNFDLLDYTLDVIQYPSQYHAEDMVSSRLSVLAYFVAKLFYNFLPGYLWILHKRQ
jgi:SAM-dependent methyltransferase